MLHSLDLVKAYAALKDRGVASGDSRLKEFFDECN